jgi:hypothetical protein
MTYTEVFRIPEAELKARLLPRLMGQVFHVTTRRAWASIQQDGSIKPNPDGERPFTYPQSAVSYFQKKGCVCLFDLRTATVEQVEEALPKYYFLNPFSDNRPVFLILNQAGYGRLIPWSVSIPEEGCRAMVIPHVEAGYPSEIPLSLIESVLIVAVRKRNRKEVQHVRLQAR